MKRLLSGLIRPQPRTPHPALSGGSVCHRSYNRASELEATGALRHLARGRRGSGCITRGRQGSGCIARGRRGSGCTAARARKSWLCPSSLALHSPRALSPRRSLALSSQIWANVFQPDKRRHSTGDRNEKKHRDRITKQQMTV